MRLSSIACFFSKRHGYSIPKDIVSQRPPVETQANTDLVMPSLLVLQRSSAAEVILPALLDSHPRNRAALVQNYSKQLVVLASLRSEDGEQRKADTKLQYRFLQPIRRLSRSLALKAFCDCRPLNKGIHSRDIW